MKINTNKEQGKKAINNLIELTKDIKNKTPISKETKQEPRYKQIEKEVLRSVFK